MKSAEVQVRISRSYKDFLLLFGLDDTDEAFESNYAKFTAWKAQIEAVVSKTHPKKSNRRGTRLKARLIQERPLVCVYCGERLTPRTAEADHVVPLSNGGTNDIENLALCCRRCNTEKFKYNLLEFLVNRNEQRVN